MQITMGTSVWICFCAEEQDDSFLGGKTLHFTIPFLFKQSVGHSAPMFTSGWPTGYFYICVFINEGLQTDNIHIPDLFPLLDSVLCFSGFDCTPVHGILNITTAWRVLRLRMEERPPIWRVAANKLNKQSRTADEGWSSSLGVGRGSNNASPWKPMLRTTH